MIITFAILSCAVLLVLALVWRFQKTTRKQTIVGIVRAGHNRGSETGARTANLDVALAKDLVPGLYVVDAQVDRETHRGLLYYGFNMLSGVDCLEVHLFDFDKDIYGRQMIVTTKQFIRRPKIFKDLQALAVQIEKDIALAKKV